MNNLFENEYRDSKAGQPPTPMKVAFQMKENFLLIIYNEQGFPCGQFMLENGDLKPAFYNPVINGYITDSFELGFDDKDCWIAKKGKVLYL